MKVLHKKRESLGELQAKLKKCATRLRNADARATAAIRNAEKARDDYERTQRELNETFIAVKSANRA